MDSHIKPHGKNLRRGRVSIPNQIYLLTTVTRNREPVFDNFYHARQLIMQLIAQEEKQAVQSLAYVVMPNHFHWLVALQQGTIDAVMKQVKGGSSRRINDLCSQRGSLWQTGYHDHAVRRDEDLRQVARYLVANPLRAGLVNQVMDYPHWDAIWME